uniref:RING-H2 finger protein ATL67 n=1 Tax=Elaeis guineensis var. tenera TaxID=51953 RepID=A0A6I9QY25_ELAGV|nr:RING-H2 finger protein ATL67 [Elaeis guineensis]
MSFSPTADDNATATSSPPNSSSSFFLQNLSNLGLGYAIAIALGVLVLLSTVLLASYVCCRARSRNTNPNPNGGGTGGNSNGVVLPRIIFVAEDDNDEDNNGEEGGRGSAPTGLDPAAISSYPRFPFSAAKGGDTVCSICLGEYREGEMLRMMPDCRHYFHLPCIDEWLRLNASCPVCRNSPMPTPVSTPLSTPLSELVPLSHFAADRRRR